MVCFLPPLEMLIALFLYKASNYTQEKLIRVLQGDSIVEKEGNLIQDMSGENKTCLFVKH